MATYTGSGRFVAICPNNNGYDDLDMTGIHGVTFGSGTTPYLSVSTHYTTNNNEITDWNMTIQHGTDPNTGDSLPMYIGLPALQQVNLKATATQTGSVRVVKGVNVDSNWYATPQYSYLEFYCGFLVRAT